GDCWYDMNKRFFV
ncbi:putative hemolysin activator HlyB domain protein, partial [Escherichia coli 95.0943]